MTLKDITRMVLPEDFQLPVHVAKRSITANTPKKRVLALENGNLTKHVNLFQTRFRLRDLGVAGDDKENLGRRRAAKRVHIHISTRVSLGYTNSFQKYRRKRPPKRIQSLLNVKEHALRRDLVQKGYHILKRIDTIEPVCI